MCRERGGGPKKGLAWMPLEMGMSDLFKVLMSKLLWGKKRKSNEVSLPSGHSESQSPDCDWLGAREWSGMHS